MTLSLRSHDGIDVDVPHRNQMVVTLMLRFSLGSHDAIVLGIFMAESAMAIDDADSI